MPLPKLLLVEDDPALAELLEFRFKGEGYQVQVTDDGTPGDAWIVEIAVLTAISPAEDV